MTDEKVASEGRIPAITARLLAEADYHESVCWRGTRACLTRDDLATDAICEHCRAALVMRDAESLVRVLTQERDDWRDVGSQLQRRLQPAGSPPPGTFPMLARWIIFETVKRLEQAESSRLLLVRQLGEMQKIDNGNPFIFCDYVDGGLRGCVRGAGHNGPHGMGMQPYPLAPVRLDEQP